MTTVINSRRCGLIAGTAATLAVAAMGFAGAAQARDNVYWSAGVGAPGALVNVGNALPVYTQPRVIYTPPTVVYTQPAPVYYQPAPLYVQPRPYYGQPQVVYVQPGHHYGWYKNRRHGRHHDRDDHDNHGGHGFQQGHQQGYQPGYQQGYAPIYYRR